MRRLASPFRKPSPILLFEEFLAARMTSGIEPLPLKDIEADLVLHSHCHERALGLENAAQTALKLIPQLAISAAPPSCCGLNGITGMTPGHARSLARHGGTLAVSRDPKSGPRRARGGDGILLPQANP